ncbi:MAG: M28 family peptidase, partial [Gemmataceae bacterium]|nr:M28 family peptidase [Gemmataceae bacterium]
QDKAPTLTPAELDKALLAEVKDRSELMKNLEYLSDVIGPRLTGSKGAEKANQWTAEKMREYGLANVKLESWEVPVGWERGPAHMKVVQPETNRDLTVASIGWTPGIKGGKVTGEVVILRGKNKDDLQKYKGRLKNAVVITRPPSNVAPITSMDYLGKPTALPKKEDYFLDPKAEPKKDEPKKEEKKGERLGLDYFPISTTTAQDKDDPKKDDKKDDPKKGEPNPNDPPIGQSFAVPARELDAFLLAEGAACKVADSGKPHGLLMAYGQWRPGDRGEPEDMIASLVVAHDHYAMLWRLASRPAPFVTKVEVECRNTFVPGPVTVFNTVGEVKGSEKPDEFVVCGAHLDSWDLASGTTDNGTGSCTVLETARVVSALAKKGYPPKRTIRFCLFTGEEEGLYGSREYVRRHKDEMPKTSAALVHDTGTGRMIGWSLTGHTAAYQVLEPKLATLFELEGWRGCDLGRQGGSDHLSFEQAGVPGFCGRQDPDEYRLTHHTQTDLFDKAKGPNLNQAAQVMSVTAVRIGNLPDLLPRGTAPVKPVVPQPN